MSQSKTAIVIGATGMVGSELIRQLISDDRFAEIKIFGRRTSSYQHSKIREHIIDFDKPSGWNHLVTGDVLFSALGTTIKQAGSKAAQYKVDHNYQYMMAKAASENKVTVYVLVSSAMANAGSGIFYTRMKGDLERDIKLLPFRHIHILQPGMLVGKRKETRFGEKAGIAVIRMLNKIGIVKKQRPIKSSIVAKAMINVSFSREPLATYSLLEVFDAAGER